MTASKNGISKRPDTRRIIRQYEDYVIGCYTKWPIAFEKARGSWIWDAQGNKYLDFFSGWAVSGLGHCHPRVVAALAKQAKRLVHLPNNYYHAGQGELAEALIARSFEGKVFFCNSGAEACEAAIKLARRWGHPDRYEIITMEKSFHGRTLGAISATGQKKYQEGFGPLVPGFVHVPFNSMEAVERAVTPKTVAVMLELVQGEGGVRIADKEFMRKLRRFCDEKKLILIADEVQTGMGRTGKWFAFQHYGITPDLMMLAKSLGAGFPMGALIARKPFANVLTPGIHASTFGGNPLAAEAGLAVIETIEKEKLLSNALLQGEVILKALRALAQKFSIIREVRGLGLLAAAELTVEAGPVFEHCLKRGLLVNATQGHVIRLAPPLNVSDKEIKFAMGVLQEALEAARSSVNAVK